MSGFTRTWAAEFNALLSPDLISRSLQRVVLIVILSACTIVRLAGINAPALDRTGWKEIDYIEISTNYWQHGLNILHPELSWPAEPPRYTAMEFPIVPYLAALTYAVFGFSVYTVRALTILAFGLLSLYMFRIANRELGPLAGLLAALAAGVLPLWQDYYNFLFSDPWMLATSVMAISHFADWIDNRRRSDWILAMVAFSLAISLKLYPLYLLIPMAWIVYRRHTWNVKSYVNLGVLTFCALLLPVAWYSYAYYLKTHSTDFFYIFDERKFEMSSMLEHSQWYYTMVHRIAAMTHHIGIALAVTGFVAGGVWRRGGLFYAYLVATAVFFLVIAQGNAGASYYQWAIIPPLAVLVSLGAVAFVSLVLALPGQREWGGGAKRLLASALCVAVVTMVGVGKYVRDGASALDPARPVFAEEWSLAQKLKEEAGADAKLVTVGEYALYAKGKTDVSPVIYYYSGFPGWPLSQDEWSVSDVTALIKKGATHFVAVNISREPTMDLFLQQMKSLFTVVYDGSEGLVIDLRQPRA